MCGIVGIGGNLFFKEEKTMQSLFLLDYFRGTDSTGLAAVRTTGEVKICKDATDPISLFQYPRFKEALSANNSKLFLGHNRASTSGATNKYNSHPFQCGHITGVMNGTLEYKDKDALEKKVEGKFDVDSEALFANIEVFGIKETIEMLHEGSDSARGAWALVWYNQKEDTLNFLRNKHRPLWLAWDKGFNRLFFASKWEYIHHACREASPEYDLEKYEYKDPEKKGQTYRFFHVPENQHWKFNLAEMCKGSNERPKPIAKMIAGKEPVSSGYATAWDPFQRNGNQLGVHSKNVSKSSSTSSTTTSLGSDRNGYGILHLYPTQPNKPYGAALDLNRFEELIQYSSKSGSSVGCSYCYADIKYGDTGITVFDQQDTIMCAKCSGNESDSDPIAKVYVSPALYAIMKKAA